MVVDKSSVGGPVLPDTRLTWFAVILLVVAAKVSRLEESMIRLGVEAKKTDRLYV